MKDHDDAIRNSSELKRQVALVAGAAVLAHTVEWGVHRVLNEKPGSLCPVRLQHDDAPATSKIQKFFPVNTDGIGIVDARVINDKGVDFKNARVVETSEDRWGVCFGKFTVGVKFPKEGSLYDKILNVEPNVEGLTVKNVAATVVAYVAIKAAEAKLRK